MKSIDFKEIIKHSWQITWRNKWLWVLGMVIIAFGGSGLNILRSFNFNIPKTDSGIKPEINDLKNQTTNVLGEATNFLKDWILSIPAEKWIILILLFLIFVVFTSVINWVIKNWAKGALISGLQDADYNLEVNLKTVSSKGIAKIKDLIVFELISSGIFLTMIIGLVLIIGLGLLLKSVIPAFGNIWLAIFGILGILGFLSTIVILAMLPIYAERLIVLKNYSPWQAFKKGFFLSKGNFLLTFLMWIINSTINLILGFLSIIVLLFIFGIPGFLLIYPLFKNGFASLNIGQVVGLVGVGILFFSINYLISSIFLVFNYGNWNLFFKQIFFDEKNE